MLVIHCGECPQTFWGIWKNIPGNVVKHFRKCYLTFQEMSSNIPGNVTKPNILGNVPKQFGECGQTFQGMWSNIPRNVSKYPEECRQTFHRLPQTFQGMSPYIALLQGSEMSAGLHCNKLILGI